MNRLIWSTSENVGFSSTFNSTSALLTTWQPPARQSVSVEVVATVGLIVCSIASCANAVVLAVLMRARRHVGSSVHTLIANQCAMDLFAAVFAICSFVVLLTHGYNYNANEITDGMICVLFEGAALTVVGLTAEKFGLVVITLERYFKIAHAIAHRKYYRDWMTKVGVALPWIGGMCLILFPSIGTTRIVDGRCRSMSDWPNEGMAKVSNGALFSCVLFCVK